MGREGGKREEGEGRGGKGKRGEGTQGRGGKGKRGEGRRGKGKRGRGLREEGEKGVCYTRLSISLPLYFAQPIRKPLNWSMDLPNAYYSVEKTPKPSLVPRFSQVLYCKG